MALIIGADASQPFDYGLLPQAVSVILGYVGGDTPHAWSTAEIAAATATGRAWWPIWTAPSGGQALTATQGRTDGAGTLNALRARGIDKALPVFYDVETADWYADPAGARAGIDAWKTVLAGGGYPHAFAYVPYNADFDWVAYWDNVQLTELPAGWVGHQYGGNAVNGHADLSVFDTDRLGINTMSDAQLDVIIGLLKDISHGLGQIQGEPTHPATGPTGSLQNLRADVQAVTAAVKAIPPATGGGIGPGPGFNGTIELTPKP